MKGLELNFIGIGSGFCQELGTTSAYFKYKSNLLIIDCGETVFNRLKNSEILDNVLSVYFIFTHAHSDHIGSLGTLIFFLYFIKKVKINIVLNRDLLYYADILDYLRVVGVEKQMFNIVDTYQLLKVFNIINSIEFRRISHVEGYVSYAIKLTKCNLNTYYTGDSSDKQFLLNSLSDKNIFRLYTDCTISKRESTHTQFDYLKEIVPNELRNKVFCIHLSNVELIEMCKIYGFQVPEICY